MSGIANYTDDDIKTLSPREHIRLRPGMYIGKLGDGTAPDDGIYVLIKEVMDNSVDEFIMGAGKVIEITVEGKAVTIRDYGRGIPLKSLAAAVSEMNTGGKYGFGRFRKDGRPQWGRRQGREYAFERVYGAQRPRRRGAHGPFRRRYPAGRHLGERRERTYRYIDPLCGR